MIAYILIALIVILYIIKTFCYKKKSVDPLKKLLKNAAKFNDLAKKEENAIKSLILSSYSIGYMRAMKDIATNEELKKVNYIVVQQDILDVHNNITENVFKVVGSK